MTSHRYNNIHLSYSTINSSQMDNMITQLHAMNISNSRNNETLSLIMWNIILFLHLYRLSIISHFYSFIIAIYLEQITWDMYRMSSWYLKLQAAFWMFYWWFPQAFFYCFWLFTALCFYLSTLWKHMSYIYLLAV